MTEALRTAVTAGQLAAAAGLPAGTIRHHCRARTGLLYGKATKHGTQWLIPFADAAAFLKTYEPYVTLRTAEVEPSAASQLPTKESA